MHIVVLTATLLVLLCLPCIVAVVLCADETADRAAWVRRRRRETRALRRLDRSLRPDGPVPTPRAEACLTIEQLAADLRRLDRQRHSGVTTESAAWLAAVLRAYDERLRLASRCLGIAEHLALLNGMNEPLG